MELKSEETQEAGGRESVCPRPAGACPCSPSSNSVPQTQESCSQNAHSLQSTARPPKPELDHLEHLQPNLGPGLPPTGRPTPLSGPQLCPLLSEGPPGSLQGLTPGWCFRQQPPNPNSAHNPDPSDQGAILLFSSPKLIPKPFFSPCNSTGPPGAWLEEGKGGLQEIEEEKWWQRGPGPSLIHQPRQPLLLTSRGA